jgi:Tfp pilus assembly protein PilF
MKLTWILPTCFLLAGCAAQQLQLAEHIEVPAHSVRYVLEFNETKFGEAPEIIGIEDVFRLSREQEADFLKYFHSPLRRNTPAHERVYTYLQDITMDFGYQGETLTAKEALQSSSGNCLSLAILTTALAKLANVDAAYQLVDSAPIYESHGDIVYKGQHVRTKLFSPGNQVTEGTFTLSRQGVLIDYFPTAGSRFISNITEKEYIAMYYNNLASEAIAREDYNTAFWLLQKTLQLTPDDAGAINSMAVVHRRAGDLEKAEEIYRYGIDYLADKISFLRNYRVLLEQQGRFNEVQQINRRLTALDDPSPFDWLHAGHGAFSEGNFQEAALFYRKAARIAPYLHESYAGLAKAYYMIGDREAAEREFKKALEYTQRPSTRSMYEAKLVALSQGF